MAPTNNHEHHQQLVQGIQRSFTWVNEEPTPDIIKSFIEEYWFPGHWESLAECARDLVKDEVEKSELQAIVTCRAKTEDRLREKLKMRHKIRNYQTIKDIRNDVCDLAGIRIILIVSTPEQREKVKSILHSIWGNDIEEKPHQGSGPTEPTSAYKPKHIGYEAEHYRPFMLKNQAKGSYKHKAGDRVEVQVVSALGNAWAEAGHDVLYKTHAYGEPSLTEYRILDALNGFVRSGEVLLEQFQEAFMRRTKTKWEHRDQVGTFLREVDVLQGRNERDKFGDDLNILFQYLQRTEQNYPLAVRNALIRIGYTKKPEELQVEDIINELEPAELEIAENMRATLCLILRMISEHKEEDLKKFCSQYEITSEIPTAAVPHCLAIMITALTILREFLGQPYKTTELLEEVEMDDNERKSLTWVLGDVSRQIGLAVGESSREEHEIVKAKIQPLWKWFQEQTKSEVSIFRLCFRLAQMRDTSEINAVGLLSQLRIPPLSRASTFSNDEEGCEEDKVLKKRHNLQCKIEAKHRELASLETELQELDGSMN